MCFFSQPTQAPATVRTPSVNSEDARRRRAQQMAANEQQRGRAATVLTTPLGDPNFGRSINRTTLVGV
jgi:hypothetical protein